MDLVPLQRKIHSFAKKKISRQIFLLYFGKGNFGREKIYFSKK
jgi:hypothetical protein